MAHPVDASVPAKDAASSLSVAPLGTSYRSTEGSSVVSNSSLLDLYARSPGSFPGSLDTPLQSDSNFTAAGSSNISLQPSASASTSITTGLPTPLTTRGFQASNPGPSAITSGFSLPPSDSNASIWTTASASANTSGPQSKRASVIGFDIDAMHSVQPANESSTSDPSIGFPSQPLQTGTQETQNDSDGSHYDEDEMPGAFSHDTTDRPADRTLEAPIQLKRNATASTQTNEPAEVELFSNALPSPPVPRRTSSVMQDSFNISPSPSQSDGIASSFAKHAMSRSSSGQLILDQIPPRRSSADFRDEAARNLSLNAPTHVSQEASISHAALSDPTPQTSSRGPASPTKGTALQAVNEDTSNNKQNSSRYSDEPSLEEQRRLEKQLLAEADESRPRTLKEARERARLRKQQGDAMSPPSSSASNKKSAGTTTSPSKSASLHIRDVASSATAAAPTMAVDESISRTSIDSRDRPSRNPKRLSNRDDSLVSSRRSLSERSTPSDYSDDSDVEGAFTFDKPATRSDQHLGASAGDDQPATSMNDLTDAVEDAMNDLSFGDETISAEDEFTTPMPAPTVQEDAPARLPTSLSSAKSLASVTGAATDAVRPSLLASPTYYTQATPKTPLFPTGISDPSLVTPPPGSPIQQRTAQAGYAPQRSVPQILSRIDVYGKTLPMPKAFVSSNIIVDKKRASSWERASSYARCTNELLHLETGLSVWMQVVQRPAMRQQNSRPNKQQPDDWIAHASLPRHFRNEASYADSIRSDMTFPMRGDGAKAKEIVSVMPTMAESPVQDAVNLPYPGVVQPQQPQQLRSNSVQSLSSSNPAVLASTTHVSLPASRSSGLASGNRFFGGLGRKGSKRTQTSATTSNAGAVSSLSSAAAAVGGSRAYLANNRSTRTASPGGAVVGSIPSSRPSTDTFETSYSSHSRPESPATGAGRVSGLGLGALGGETVSSPLASASNVRMDAGRETNVGTSMAAASSSGTTGLRAPMGPRAPNTMARSGTGSGQMHTSTAAPTRPITPVTPITPISPISGGFGSGPTFVSRLGGASFSSASHAPLRSPNREFSLADYLAPRRTSDVSGALTSPPLSSNSTHETGSAVMGTSPRLLGATAASGNGSGALRSSLSYSSVRDRIRRGSQTDVDQDAAFQHALVKLSDILPDADLSTLKHYLKKAKGNDLVAIGDYLQDQSLGKLPQL